LPRHGAELLVHDLHQLGFGGAITCPIPLKQQRNPACFRIATQLASNFGKIVAPLSRFFRLSTRWAGSVFIRSPL